MIEEPSQEEQERAEDGDALEVKSAAELALLLRLSSLSCLEVIVMTLPKFVNPNLDRVLSAVLSKAVMESSGKQLRVKAGAVLSVLATQLPFRLLLPPRTSDRFRLLVREWIVPGLLFSCCPFS